MAMRKWEIYSYLLNLDSQYRIINRILCYKTRVESSVLDKITSNTQQASDQEGESCVGHGFTAFKLRTFSLRLKQKVSQILLALHTRFHSKKNFMPISRKGLYPLIVSKVNSRVICLTLSSFLYDIYFFLWKKLLLSSFLYDIYFFLWKKLLDDRERCLASKIK